MESSNFCLSKEVLDEIKNFYLEYSDGSNEWKSENSEIKKIIPLISNKISPRYKILQKCLGVGDTCIIFKCMDNNLNIPCALKFPRPNPLKAKDFSEIVEEEISHLMETRHPNIIQIYFQDSFTFVDREIHFYLMEFIPNAQDALDFFKSQPRSLQEIVSVIEPIVKGISHLHKNNIVHIDIKLENMFISAEKAKDGQTIINRAVIADLGSARKLFLEGESDGNVKLVFTEPYAHPELIEKIAGTLHPDENRRRAELKRSELKKSFDLFSLGKNLRRILKLHDITEWKNLDFYHRKYLELLAVRLLDGKNLQDETALGLPISAFKEFKYNDISEVEIDIKKITGEYPIQRIVPEMDKNGIKTIQISGISTTVFTERLNNIVKHQAFRRLGDVTQLGFINLIYPTATHSRMEHVLGTLSNVVCYCDALYNDPVNPLFKQIINVNDLNAVLLAGLLHDLGQYPLAHDFEEAESKIFSHEEIIKKMLDSNRDSLELLSLRETIIDEWNVEPKRIIEIITANPNTFKSSIKDRLLHTIIDSPIDADKLDYLVRDSVNLNIPFGKAIDYQRLFKSLTVIFKEQEHKVYIALGIHEKGRIPAETVAFVRYAMFGTVYWHHTSRSMKSMLHRSIWEALESYETRENKVLKIEEFEVSKFKPPKTSKSKDLKDLKSDFINFIFTEKKDIQLELFKNPPNPSFKFSQISSSDLRIINWLNDYTTEAGSTLLKMLCNREIYKRILVISQKNFHLWEELIDFRKNYGWKGVIELQKKFQDLIINEIRQFEPLKRTTSVLCPDATMKIIELNEKGYILFLIDIPVDRPGSEIKLEYLPESDRREMLEEWKAPSTLEHSIIWKQFEDSFIKSVGKIRVFCYPDIDATVIAAINKEGLESYLEDSLSSSEAYLKSIKK